MLIQYFCSLSLSLTHRLLPYVYGHVWGWSTIPLVFLAAFAWFGIDAAAEECEAPFHEKRVNSLDMDTFCLGFMATAFQEIRDKADDEIEASTNIL